jgi:hypothetical protein
MFSAIALFISVSATAAAPLSVRDTIETTRLIPASVRLDDSGHSVAERVTARSPDGQRYAALLLRGDVSRDGVWCEILSGKIGSSVEDVDAKIVARLFSRTRFYLGKRTESLPGTNLAWLADNESVVFGWDDERGNTQAVAVRVTTGHVRFLTNHPTDVYKFDVASNRAVLYSARSPTDPEAAVQLAKRGFVVRNDSVFSLLDGDNSGQGTGYQRFIVSPAANSTPRQVTGGREIELFPPFMDAVFSPDGKRAIVVASPAEVNIAWERYGDPLLVANVQRARHGSGQQGLSQLAQMHLVDLRTATMRPLIDAPVTNFYGLRVSWAPNGSSVLVGPTLLPSYDPATRETMAVVNVDTGELFALPISGSDVDKGIDEVHWSSADVVELIIGGESIRFQKRDRSWSSLGRGAAVQRELPKRIALRLRQDINDPPTLVAVDRIGGRERQIFDPNPQLRSQLLLGRVERVEWRDQRGRTWLGRLYLPVNHEPGRRHPLVLQTHGHAPFGEFSLYGVGSGLGPGLSIYAAQVLANRGIAVLQMQDPEIRSPSPEEPEAFVDGMDSAIDHLVGRGLVDARRIGVSGFSRSGWHVLHSLIHSRFAIAGALVSDNLEAGYVVSVLAGDHALYGEFALDHGAPRVGQGLQTWLQRAPGFNVDRIYTPLRMQRETGGLQSVLGSWELLAGLRDLEKPVELFVIPDIRNGNHGLLMPAQALASQEGAVDWFDFWLNNRESADPSKAEQYVRWRGMRQLHERDLRRRDSLSSTKHE